jgi:hypothetical protein
MGASLVGRRQVGAVDDDYSQELPEDIAAQIDRRGVMLEAAEHVEALHHATTRLGDALVAAGLSGRVWRTEDALLSSLDEELPDITIDDLITRLAEFGADTGPVWLHGDERDLEAFHHEVAVLRDVVRPLRAAAQHLRMGTAGRYAELPIERAFASVRVATPLDLLAAMLRDLELLAPVMSPLAPDEWEAPSDFEPAHPASLRGGRSRAQAPWSAQPHAHPSDFAPGAPIPKYGLLGQLAVEMQPAALLRRGQALGSWLQAHKLVAMAGLSLVLVTGIALAQLAGRPGAPRLSALVPVPSTATLSCSSRPVTVTLKNPGKQSLTWRAELLPGLSITPARGTVQAGHSAALRITALGRRVVSGTIVITATDGTASIPFTTACR